MSIDQLVNSRSWSPTSNTKSLLQVAILVVISLLAGNSQSIFAVDQTRSDQWGLGTDQPVPGDYDGDARTDLAVFRPSEGCWYIFNSANATFKREPFGVSTDQPVAADYDGDGRIDIAVFRPSNGVWYYLKSSDGSFQFQQFGATGDIPVAGDFNGDGRSDYAVWRPSTGYWYTSLNAATNYGAIRLGQVGDIPVQADYDGDGKTDATVFRPSTGTFYIWQSSVNSLRTRQWGTSTDRPLAGDFDKDGKADIGVFRPIGGTWYVLKSIDSTLFAQPWGQSSDRLIPNDYDGNRQTDMAVFSQTGGIWNILLNPVPLSPSAPIIMGETNVLSTDDSGNGNLLLAQSATLSTPANLQSLSFYVTTAAGNLRLGVYDATGPSGGPGAKKAETNEFVPTVGWNTANVTTPVQIPAGTYWIAYLPSSNTLAFKKSTTAGVSGRLYTYTYGAMPATFSTTPSSTASHWSFYAMLNGTPDTTLPVISAVSSSGISPSGATITWTTDEASDTQVEYGTTASYGSSTSLNTLMATSHSATLSGLSAGTLHHYRVKARDASGNLATSGDFTFTTSPPDTTSPAISAVASSGISSSGATITWTTNEASDTQVDYGTTTAYGSSSSLNPTMVTSHSASLSGLSANTLYHYRVKSRDASGNLATSGDSSFTTAAPDTTPPVISAVASTSISSGGATISWTTNEASDTQVEYGTTTSYGSSSSLNPTLVTSHSTSLSGLSASTLYHYRVKSRDVTSNLATSGDFTFTTTAAAAGDFYVATTGSDTNPGTQASPFRTINRGIQALGPGQTLIIKAGTYTEGFDCQNFSTGCVAGGTSWASPTTIKANPGDVVTVRPPSTYLYNGFLFYGTMHYIVIDGITFDGSTVGITSNGMKVTQDAHHIRIQNCVIQNFPRSGILMSNSGTVNSDYNELINTTFNNNGTSGSGHNIYMSTSFNLVDRCTVTNGGKYGIQIYVEGNPVIGHDNVVRNSVFGNNGRSGIGIFTGSNHLVYNNVSYGNNDGGILVRNDWNNLQSPKIYNNTVFGNGPEPGIYIQSLASGGASVRNNISFGNSGAQYQDGTGTTVQTNNLFGIDPKFVNAAGHDFHLLVGSPAINTGMTLGEVPTALDGVLRPQSGAYDIGAYER